MLPALPLLLLLAAPSSEAGTASVAQALRFGVEVAQKGLWKEALFRFEQAAKMAPDDPKALNNLAVALEQAGEFDRARAAYEKALELAPDNMHIQQNYDLFREADDKRNRKKSRR
jgi:Flp pilus assembly protein TadD